MIDGVALPQELNRDIGGEINLNDLSFVDLIEGAYPAQDRPAVRFGVQYVDASRDRSGGLRRVCVVRMPIRTHRPTFGYHAPIAGGGGYSLAFSGDQSTPRARPAELRLAAQRRKFGQPVCAPHAAERRKQLYQRHLHQQQQHVSDPERRRQRRAGVDGRHNETQADTFSILGSRRVPSPSAPPA